MKFKNVVKKNWVRLVPFIQIAPATLYLIIFMVAPTFIFLIYSFWKVKGFELIKTFTLDNYLKIFTSELYTGTFINSIYIGVLVSIIVVIMGYILSYGLRFFFGKYKDLIVILVFLSVFGSYLVRIYAWKSILGASGLINGVLMALRLIEQPSTIFMYNRTAVIITLVNLYIPYTFVTIFSSMQYISRNHIEASRDLGASSFKTFFKVTLPLTFSGVVSGFIVTFVFSSSDFVISSLLGGRTGLMVSKIISDQFGIVYNWPLGSALSIVWIIVLFIILMLVSSLPRVLKIGRVE